MLGASFGHVLEQILICKKSVDTAGLQRFPRFVREKRVESNASRRGRDRRGRGGRGSVRGAKGGGVGAGRWRRGRQQPREQHGRHSAPKKEVRCVCALELPGVCEALVALPD